MKIIPEANNFIEEIVVADLEKGTHDGRVHTRFPPEPNGYLHIGHVKSIVLNFGLAQKFGGKCNLRFDDTNPVTEEEEYIDSILRDVKWLGFEWDGLYFASDYFPILYEYAIKLINKGLAYVDDSSLEEIAEMRGNTFKQGINSPYRQRSIQENLDLFENMKAGKYSDGEKVLRAKIDMANPNMHMRDPILYRIKHAHHHRTGDEWCIYPMYDFAHGQSDSIERITHSICTLEFIPHRPLYDWLIEELEIFPSHQYEFARLNVSYMMMSKRKLLKLVNEQFVQGWDDPRMPTVSGLRRRGYTAESLRNFVSSVGVQKRDNVIEYSHLEFYVRENLNKIATRVMAVLDPIRMVIDNYPMDQQETIEVENNPEDNTAGNHKITFSNEIWIEREDFMEDPPKKYFRLYPGGMVRLKHGYIVECTGIEKNENGELITIHSRYIPESKSGEDTSGLKVKGTIHWVNAKDCAYVNVNLYEHLFTTPDPAGYEGQLEDIINPNSLTVIENIPVEKYLVESDHNHFQFMRKGYFVKDEMSTKDIPIYNKTVGLKDSWTKEMNKIPN